VRTVNPEFGYSYFRAGKRVACDPPPTMVLDSGAEGWLAL
jgi:hypothetical protein